MKMRSVLTGKEYNFVYLNCELSEAEKPLREIMRHWYDLSADYGDIGSCVIGAGFNFKFNGEDYKMSSCSPWQGSCSWESCIDTIHKELEKIGATEIYYDWGTLD